ncbi:hypothetical protein SAMN05660350_02120 [Geodermatophilus obscurus]|uniref:Uncharacterized protein n=1 Tax=Geodermatophilus obscurus TaxID=1861 RepID=A0A1M7TS30_9ACTN|nr:hypothetical protein [Geodermatophilus obscurus]SHN73486.1 hypothetical protein SAMN05660350_02120 [Geodermatophilus obscurus]
MASRHEAIKVGIPSADSRVRTHLANGYRPATQWTGLDHDIVVTTEREVLTAWRAAGIAPVHTAPRDGWTGTAPAEHPG